MRHCLSHTSYIRLIIGRPSLQLVSYSSDPSYSMFSNSYNPISFEQLSPGSSSDLRKREEQARRQRLLEQANRRRLARLERIRRMEEQLIKEEMARETEIYNWQHEQAEEDEQRHYSRLDLLSQREEGEERGDDDIMLASSYPPQFIYATISKSQEEVEEPTAKPPPKIPSGQNMHHRSRYCNDLPVPSINLQAQHSQQEEIQEVSDEKMETDEDNDTSVPPHIIANDVSDDDNENDDDDDDILKSIWDQVPSIPPPPWLDPSDKFRTCE